MEDEILVAINLRDPHRYDDFFRECSHRWTAKNMNILITGGSGSFGHAMTEHLLRWSNVGRIVIYSRDEHKQEAMARKFTDERMRFFIGDVRSPSRLELAMKGIDTVIHAAAMKIVPTAEYNPTECIATNIGGAENVIRMAIRCGVSKVLALSTDKAVNPVNLYGATKLCAEKAFIAANALAAGDCLFSVMRYGNVVGSNGSVVPVFRRLLADGKPITITDKRMTRFWITMPQAIAFASQCLQQMKGKEIFVPQIPSINITDLAKAMGATQVNYTGIRPGEKINETLISAEEGDVVNKGNYYIIYPSGSGTKDTIFGEWSYTSSGNSKWLTIEQIKETIA